MSTDMIDNRLNDMRLNAKFGHAGHQSTAEIVQPPICEVDTLIEALFRLAPARKWSLATAKDQVAINTPG